MRYLVLMLIIVPAAEIAILLLSGKTIGVLPTLAIIILTGVLGGFLAKKQGLEVVRKFQMDMQYGRVPGEALLDGICILIGGILLLSPGYITDAAGFLLLIPATRSSLKVILLKIFKHWIDKKNVTIIR